MTETVVEARYDGMTNLKTQESGAGGPPQTGREPVLPSDFQATS